MEVLTAGYAYRNAMSVPLRRAALQAIRYSLQAYIVASTSVTSYTGTTTATTDSNNSVLGTLLNVSSLAATGSSDDMLMGDDLFTGGANSSRTMLAIMQQPAIVQCVDWAAATWKDDPDDISRVLKRELLNIVVSSIS